LIDYKNTNNIAVYTNKEYLGYYLAGLLEGDGHLSLPSIGNTTLNRILNPRIVWGKGVASGNEMLSLVHNLVMINLHTVLSEILLKSIRLYTIFRPYSQMYKFNLVVSKALILASWPSKEISPENMIPLYHKNLFVGIFLSGG